jgi:hypothetical protein
MSLTLHQRATASGHVLPKAIESNYCQGYIRRAGRRTFERETTRQPFSRCYSEEMLHD